jgi:hypothetical protein
MERDNLMHGARTALNHDQDIRDWCENYLKEKHKGDKPEMNDEEFAKFWRYHRPEIMHEGAAEAMQAFKNRTK